MSINQSDSNLSGRQRKLKCYLTCLSRSFGDSFPTSISCSSTFLLKRFTRKPFFVCVCHGRSTTRHNINHKHYGGKQRRWVCQWSSIYFMFNILDVSMLLNYIHENIPDARIWLNHYTDVIMGPIASQITSLTIVYSTVYSDAVQREHPSSASLAFVRGIHRRPVNSPPKWPVTRKMFPFYDVIMYGLYDRNPIISHCIDIAFGSPVKV